MRDPAVARYGVITLMWLALFLTRLTGPADLMDNDQERPAAYVLDVTLHGNWIVQRDHTNDIASKPPLYTWLAAAATALTGGRLNDFSLYLPCALAALGVALALVRAGRWLDPDGPKGGRGEWIGFWAAAAYLLSMTTFKQLALARTDPTFTFFTFLAALLLWRMWDGRRDATWLWLGLALAAATLTKGPLGALLPLGGWALLAVRRCEARAFPWGRLAAAVGVGLAIPLLWAVAAYAAEGQDFWDKMIVRELYGHALDSHDAKQKWYKVFAPTYQFLGRFAPWSLLAVWGAWRWARAGRGPLNGANAEACARRSFGGFLLAYFLFGIGVFTLASHKRPDLNFPLLPAAALFAGYALAHGRGLREPHRAYTIAGAATAIFALAMAGFLHVARSQDEWVQRTAAARQAAEAIRDAGVDLDRLMHLPGAPFAAQYYLGTLRRETPLDEARAALRGEQPAYVVVGHDSDLSLAREARDQSDMRAIIKIGQPVEFGSSAPLVWIVTNPAGERALDRATE